MKRLFLIPILALSLGLSACGTTEEPLRAVHPNEIDDPYRVPQPIVRDHEEETGIEYPYYELQRALMEDGSYIVQPDDTFDLIILDLGFVQPDEELYGPDGACVRIAKAIGLKDPNDIHIGEVLNFSPLLN